MAILLTFAVIGGFLVLLSTDEINGPNFAWFWGSVNVGFAVAVLYLLTKIANGVHQDDTNR